MAEFDDLTANKPLKYRLAYTADLEATFTPVFKLMLDHDDTLFAPGDDRVASLFLWHFVEEVEHRSSALIIYNHVVGDPWYRVKMAPSIFRHVLNVVRIAAKGFNKHVPLEARKVDALSTFGTYRCKQAVLQRLPFTRAEDHGPVANAFDQLPLREQLISVAGIVRSQLPNHNPAHEELPALAGRWFDRYDAGYDVTAWYTAGQRRSGSSAMADMCAPTFAELARRLGFSCREAGGLLELRNPLALENWTLPVLEVTVIVGAVLALIYAFARWRRHNDPTNLVLWFGAIAYLLIIEPPLYFPSAFGIQDHVDTMFAHNVFTVDFLWGRLPLYIVAIYPMMATVAFEIVRTLGVFRRYGTLVGAICVGFVHHAFYEIFDHLGRNCVGGSGISTTRLNQPMFDSVPLPSVVVFAALWPMSLAFCVQFFVGRHVDNGKSFTGAQILRRTLVVGILASIGTVLLPLPATLIGGLSKSTTALGLTYGLELAVLTAVAATALFRQWQRVRRDESGPTAYFDPVMIRYAIGYLAVMALLWATALPKHLTAVNGVTDHGDPIGNLWYTIGCFAIAGVCIAAALSTTKRDAPVGTSAG